MQPTRHALAALLLERDRVEEATAVYRADLGYDDTLSRACRHPDNVWSLRGYHECLEHLGRHAEAAIVRQKLQIAMARTDVPVTASCCRLPVAHAVGGRDDGPRRGSVIARARAGGGTASSMVTSPAP